MLVDEPFAALTLRIGGSRSFPQRIRRARYRNFLSDHDVAQSLSLCDRIYILFEGQIIFAGSPEQVAQNARVRDTYLGSASRRRGNERKDDAEILIEAG